MSIQTVQRLGLLLQQLRNRKGIIMALNKNIQSAQGINLDNAYHRVENVMLLNKEQMSFNLRSYINSEAKFLPVKDLSFVCDYNLIGNNPIAQAYQHLKTLPEFAGATDC